MLDFIDFTGKKIFVDFSHFRMFFFARKAGDDVAIFMA